MPTEPLAALVYVFLLVPGIAYAYQIEKSRPSGRRSAFRETATVIVASSIIFVLMLGVALAVSAFSPPLSQWLDEAIRNPNSVIERYPRESLALLFGALATATAAGFFAGSVRGQGWLENLTGGGGLNKSYVSSWDTAFTRDPDALTMVSVQLNSGNWICGRLGSYDPSPIEDGNRSLVLVGPLHFRSSTSTEIDELPNAQTVVIQASEIDYLAVQYVSPEDPASPIASADQNPDE